MRTVTGTRKRGIAYLENRDREACAVLVPHCGHATFSRYDACSYGMWRPFRDCRGRRFCCLCIDDRTLVDCPTNAKRRTTSRCPEAKHGDERIACFGQERLWPQLATAATGAKRTLKFIIHSSRSVEQSNLAHVCYGMDTWPPTFVCNSTLGEKIRKGKAKTTILPHPLLEGGALTSATLRENCNHLEWITAQGRASSTLTTFIRLTDTLLTPTRVGRKLVCNKEAILAFPATQTPHLRPQTTSLLQRAEQGVCAPENMPFCNSSYTMPGKFSSDVLSGCGHPRGTYT